MRGLSCERSIQPVTLPQLSRKIAILSCCQMLAYTSPGLNSWSSHPLKGCVPAATTRRHFVPIALNILNQVCDALDYAHNLCDDTGRHLGIIHRDVSPSNIICSYAGEVKLCDFGIAKATLSKVNTKTGVIKGKVKYMSPEQALGRKLDHELDERLGFERHHDLRWVRERGGATRRAADAGSG